MAAPTDVASRADVEALLWRFYGRVLEDNVLAEPFAEIRSKGLAAHIPVMCDFWETVLFRAGLYRGNALQVHRHVDDGHRLSDSHFMRWLELWCDTVDQMYAGPVAERAKVQGARIARSLHLRLTGTGSPELDAQVGR